MKFLFTILFLLSSYIFIYAQDSYEITENVVDKISVTEKTIFYRIGNSTLPIKLTQYGKKNNLVFINLHDDENTSVDASKRVLENNGGLLIEIINNDQRNIKFRLGNQSFRVDPNRIFSKQGIEKSLTELGRKSAKAIDEAEKLGQRILQLIPSESEYVISLHNNTSEYFSIKDYASGGTRTGDCKKVFINNEQDTDDFFLTTSNDVYEKLASKGYNTILQENKKCKEDGSLSVYYKNSKVAYINCETEHGKTQQYYEMMKTLISLINPLN